MRKLILFLGVILCLPALSASGVGLGPGVFGGSGLLSGCSDQDVMLWIDASTEWQCGAPPGASGGEANRLASPDVGAEVDVINTVPLTGVNLNLKSFEADHFTAVGNIVSIDAAIIAAHHAAVTALAAGAITFTPDAAGEWGTPPAEVDAALEDLAPRVTANDAKTTNATHSGDVSGSGVLTIGADKVLESHLKSVNAATDEYCLTYESTTGDFEWETCGAGGVLWTEGTGLIHPTTADEDICDDSNCTHWSITGAGVASFAGAVDALSVTTAPSDTGAYVLTTNTLGAQVSMGITEQAGPDGQMDLNVDEAGTLTTYVLLDGAGETIDILQPLDIGTNDIITGAATIASTELDRLDGLAGIIVTDATAVTDLEGTGLSITAGVLNASGLAAPAHSQCDVIWAPSAEVQDTDDIQAVFRAPAAVTITEIYCETEGTGTPVVNMDLTNAGADVNGADIACADAGTTDSTMGGDDTVADGAIIDWIIDTVTGTTVTSVSLCFEYTYD